MHLQRHTIVKEIEKNQHYKMKALAKHNMQCSEKPKTSITQCFNLEWV
jgi:hypothetical protein